MTDLEISEGKEVLVDDLAIQNLSIHKDKIEEELPEVTYALVAPPEAFVETPVTEVTKPENNKKESNR